MSRNSGVSRRNFMRTAAAAATVPAALAGTTAHAAPADVRVAATVVRASHSKSSAGALKIGVRASVLADGFEKDIVVTVDGVRFGSSADETRKLITKTVQERIASVMAERDAAVAPDRIAVQVFGGVL